MTIRTSTSHSSSIDVVVVTYGSRAEMAVDACRRALDQGVRSCIVVDNAASPPVNKFVRPDEPISIIVNHRNVGSAPGFAAGMRRAASGKPSHVLLLDDDNYLSDGCVNRLVEASVGAVGPVMVSATRVMSGDDPGSSFSDVRPTVRGSFLYFDLATYVRDRLHLYSRGSQTQLGNPHLVSKAPYGGLLIPWDAMEIAGFPQSELVLYEDDTIYTTRAVTAGVSILKSREAVVVDLEAKWTNSSGRLGPGRLINSNARSRLFYATRNRVYYDVHVQAGSRIRIIINALTFLAVCALSTRTKKNLRNFKTLMHAIWCGATGRLGEEIQYPLDH